MNRRIRYILIGVGILAVALAVFFLLLNPIRNDISDLESQKIEEQGKIDNLTVQLRQYEALRDKSKWNQARLLELSKMIPERAEIPSLIIQIEYLADKAGIEVIRITPGSPGGGEGAYWTMTFSLNFSGTFYHVVDFMDRVEKMVGGPGRLLTVKSVSLAPRVIPGTVSDVEESVTMTLYAFVLPEQ